MDLNEIVVYAKVVETKSFTAAADELGLPKSTVSRKVAQLEERLGVRLLQRTTRKLALTDVGSAYYERCARIVADITAAEKLVTDMQSSPQGLLRVTAPVDVSSRYMGSILASFTLAYPEINIELDASDRTVDLIEEGFDLGVRVGPLSESSLIARRLTPLTSVLVAAPNYLARRSAPTTPTELAHHELILFVPSSRMQTWLLRGPDGKTHEVGPPVRMVTNSLLAALENSIAGGGIGLIPDFLVADALADGRLLRVLDGWQTDSSELYAVYPSTRNLSPKLRVFLDHLVASMNPPPWRRS